MLKSQYLVLNPSPPFEGEGLSKGAKTALLATLSAFLEVSTSLQTKMNATL
jgi:hypothetical protein